MNLSDISLRACVSYKTHQQKLFCVVKCSGLTEIVLPPAKNERPPVITPRKKLFAVSESWICFTIGKDRIMSYLVFGRGRLTLKVICPCAQMIGSAS